MDYKFEELPTILQNRIKDGGNESACTGFTLGKCGVGHGFRSNRDAYSEKCIQSEQHETIRMLCMLPKEMLIDRINGVPCDEISEQWVDRVDIEMVNEALKRYDEPVFADERAEMLKTL